jgi:hypothetical protein
MVTRMCCCSPVSGREVASAWCRNVAIALARPNAPSDAKDVLCQWMAV